MFSKEDEEASRPLADRVDESEEENEALASLQQRRSGQRSKWFAWLGGAVVLIATSVVSMQIGAYMARTSTAKLDSSCAEHTTQWSPVLRDVGIRYEWKEFNGSFMSENIYRKEGSPEVDAAWEALGVDYRAGPISTEDGLASGLDDTFVQRNKKYGSGFLVNVEGMHHLHCLNLLRKSLYFNYDRYKKMGHHAFSNEDRILRLHVTHCLDIIRQTLMCNVDTGVLGQVWAGGESPAAFPDFNTKHRCKNYDDVRKWAEKLQAPPVSTVPPDYLKSPGPHDVIPVIP